MADDSQIKNDFVNEIVISMYADIGEECATRLKNVLYMNLTRYDMSMKSTDVAIYKGDETEILLRKFLIAKKIKGCTDRTIQYYKCTCEMFFNKVQKSPMDVDADDIRLYIAERQAKDKVSNVTINNERRNISSFFDWLQKEEIRLKNPMVKIDAIKEVKKKKHAFTELEIETMRNCIKDEKNKAIYEILVSTWARVSEVAQIRIDEIEGDKLIVHGKGQKDRTVYLNAKAQIAIQNYMQLRSDDNPYLFPRMVAVKKIGKIKEKKSKWYQNPDYIDKGHTGAGTIEYMIRKVGKSNNIQANPHKFRRTGATMALRSGMPIEQVSRILGHNSIETTQIYLDIKESDVKDAYDKYAR